MLKYKVFIPVTAQVEMFTNCLTKIPDKTKLVVMNNFVNPQIGDICKRLESEGAEVIWQQWNPGVAPSFNIAMKRMDKNSDNLDYAIVLSPACLFNRSVEDWADQVEMEEGKEKRYYYNAQANFLSDMHCIAFTRKMYDEFGLWDENLQPYGYDDQDTQHRFQLMGVSTTMLYGCPRTSQQLGGGIGTDPRLQDHFMRSAGFQQNYYIRKWGGVFTQETYSRPFDNPKNDINYWKLETENIAKLII
jgi:hypothetical protein